MEKIQPEPLDLNVFTLAFPPQDESQFLKHYAAKTLGHVRLAFVIAIFFYAIFGILDAWLVPTVKRQLWFIRYAIFVPGVFSILLFSFSPSFKRHMQASIAAVILMAGLGIIAMTMIAPFPGNHSYYAGLILVFIYGYTFSKLRFIWATLTGWTIVMVYEVAAIWLSPTPTPILINNNFFFLSGNIIGMFACYSIEYYARRDFLQARQLEAEKKKDKAANRDLERQIKDRTAQLVAANRDLVQEIEERKSAEQALREGEEKYRTIIEDIEEGYFELDLDGNMTFFNDSMCEIMGYPRKELHGMHHRSYTHPATAEEMYRIFNGIYRTGKSKRILDFEITKKDGSKSIIEISASLRRDPNGKALGFRGVARDITAKKRIETELIQTKNFLENILDSSVDVIATTDLKGKIVYCAPKAREILGYEQEELIGRNVSQLYQGGTNDASFIMHELQEKGSLSNHEMKMKTKDGDALDVSVSASILKDEKGTVVGTLGICRDINEKKRLENQLLRSQKVEAIGTLASGIAHDFNNVLSAVIGYTELGIADLADGHPSSGHLHEVLKAGNRARDLVSQILTFTRQDGQDLKPTKISPIVREVLRFLRASIPTTIEIRHHLESISDIVLCDTTKIHQVLMNLCTNASHAMRDKGGVLEVNLTEVDINPEDASQYRDLAPGPYIQLTVSDTGHGMNRATLDRIFDPYFTTKEKGKGTGLGLSVAIGIVKSHRGAIDVTSEPDKGTTFRVFLPRVEDSASPAPEKATELLPGGSERILFVDDEEALANMGKQMLERLGYDVQTSTSSEEAFKDFRLHPQEYDLVITDMTMPGMTGAELANKLMSIRPDVAVILCTGFSELISKDGAQAAGIREFVMKPLVFHDLAAVCRKVLDNPPTRN
jgi:PAS domain S-box-containing protein